MPDVSKKSQNIGFVTKLHGNDKTKLTLIVRKVPQFKFDGKVRLNVLLQLESTIFYSCLTNPIINSPFKIAI